MSILAYLHQTFALLPMLARFAIGVVLIVVLPRLARRVHLPEGVVFLLSGVVVGPHLFEVFPEQHPAAQFFSELGMLLLMFLAGLAVNTAVREKPAKTKLEFLGRSLFIPSFFVVTGFLIDPVAPARGLVDDFALAAGIIGALLAGKWIAAQLVGRGFGYDAATRETVWSLTLPQVAATLAATLVAYKTSNAAGPAAHRCQDAQRRARHGPGHVHSRPCTDATLRAGYGPRAADGAGERALEVGIDLGVTGTSNARTERGSERPATRRRMT